jgi:hypothetical protein
MPENEPETEAHGMYHRGDLLERMVALRYVCQRNKVLIQNSAIETIKLAMNRLSELEKYKAIYERQFKALEAYALNKIAEHQEVKQISDHWEMASMRNIPFYACGFNWYCLVATVGERRRRK